MDSSAEELQETTALISVGEEVERVQGPAYHASGIEWNVRVSRMLAASVAFVVLGGCSTASHKCWLNRPPLRTKGGRNIISESSSSLLPHERTNDTNLCSDDEEMHLGLCYDKCGLLTLGTYPYRQSAWTCCREEECKRNPFRQFSCCRHNMGWCSGFDIAGMKEGNKVCPHKAGACLTDEELFLGMCYKKCSLLTRSEFPYRVAAASCCKRTDAMCAIADGAKFKFGLHGASLTMPSFNTGGGCGDDYASTPCSAHLPLKELTR